MKSPPPRASQAAEVGQNAVVLLQDIPAQPNMQQFQASNI